MNKNLVTLLIEEKNPDKRLSIMFYFYLLNHTKDDFLKLTLNDIDSFENSVNVEQSIRIALLTNFSLVLYDIFGSKQDKINSSFIHKVFPNVQKNDLWEIGPSIIFMLFTKNQLYKVSNNLYNIYQLVQYIY